MLDKRFPSYNSMVIVGIEAPRTTEGPFGGISTTEEDRALATY